MGPPLERPQGATGPPSLLQSASQSVRVQRRGAAALLGGREDAGAGETHCPTLKPGRRRKQEGAVYTPAFITRYLVEQALGGVVKQRFETLRREHETEAAGTARKARSGRGKPAGGRANGRSRASPRCGLRGYTRFEGTSAHGA